MAPIGNPHRTARPGEINFPAVDRFTLAHLGVGVLLGLIGLRWWAAAGTAIGWELIERPLKRRIPELFPHSTQDTLANAATDATAMMVGWGAVRLLRRIGG